MSKRIKKIIGLLLVSPLLVAGTQFILGYDWIPESFGCLFFLIAAAGGYFLLAAFLEED